MRGFLFCLVLLAAACAGGPRPEEIRVPPGFSVELYARVPQARSLALGDEGTLFVGGKTSEVHAVPPGGGSALLIASGLEQPHGVAFRGGALYVAERRRILRFERIEERLDDPPAPVVLRDDLPPYKHHGLRTIRFGPDGRLYVAIGFPCNVCVPEERYGVILRFSDSNEKEIVARGVRNSVGFDWHPRSGELWFTDNGRDLLGNHAPPDELNRAPRAGLDFGFPWCHGGELPDPQFGLRRGCGGFEPPALRLGAHVAALGMRFYTGGRFPPEYRGAIFIAEHGSWNRQPMSGYRVSVVRLRDGKPVSYETFADGWLRGGSAWGRPVDVIVAPDGSLLVSDDKAGAVYRISYVGM